MVCYTQVMRVVTKTCTYIYMYVYSGQYNIDVKKDATKWICGCMGFYVEVYLCMLYNQ